MKMELEKLDHAMNNLMEKYDWHDTNKQEDFFLKNLTRDLMELLHEHNVPIIKWAEEIKKTNEFVANLKRV